MEGRGFFDGRSFYANPAKGDRTTREYETDLMTGIHLPHRTMVLDGPAHMHGVMPHVHAFEHMYVAPTAGYGMTGFIIEDHGTLAASGSSGSGRSGRSSGSGRSGGKGGHIGSSKGGDDIYCSKCGTEFAGLFCSKCGNKRNSSSGGGGSKGGYGGSSRGKSGHIGRTGKVKHTWLLRKCPTIERDSCYIVDGYTRVQPNEDVQTLAFEGIFTQVRTNDGKKGWIPSNNMY